MGWQFSVYGVGSLERWEEDVNLGYELRLADNMDFIENLLSYRKTVYGQSVISHKLPRG